ncbi:MAG: MBOAT family O-acyltransferase [Ignavibacteriaceae bacterium]|nr:MBOAT family O-acyltransferase [Ignavibacteriaceae bacterium]
MVFNSFDFFIFLAITLFSYYLVPSKLRIYLLILASAIFYAYGQAAFVLLVFFVILVNFFIGSMIEQASSKKKKKLLLYLSMVLNIGVLAFFKYYNFIIQNLSVMAGLFKIKNPIPFLDIALPIGLSFYIFQTIGYMLDIYRGSQKAEKNLANFTLFILFFPKLLVGPIERTKNFLPQIRGKISFQYEEIILGLKLITWGLFQKLVIADRLTVYTDAIFNNYKHHSGITIFVSILFYSIQLYTDFAGYTNIAIGTAHLFGYNLMQNFNRPFLSKTVSDFWRRWHISLSTWVNVYIYNPIVLKRRDWGTYGITYALLISFATIGIWHGATWNFVIFGLLQSAALIFETLTVKFRKSAARIIPSIIFNSLSIVVTFLFFSFSLVFFRSHAFSDAISIIARVFTVRGEFFIGDLQQFLYCIAGIIFLMVIEIKGEYFGESSLPFKPDNRLKEQIAYGVLIILILLIGVFDGGQFIYFQF